MQTPSLFLLACCLLGCTPLIPPPDPAPPPTTTDWTQSPEGKALIARADEVLGVVEKVRGLKTDHPVKKGLMLREDLKAVLLEKLAQEYTDEEIAHEALLYKALGLIPAEMDYKAFMLTLLVEQIAGFYDDDTQALYILEGQNPDTLDEVFSHELFHAVQDQRFGISTLRDEKAKKNSDIMLARTALIEGDAVGVMLDYSLQAQNQSFTDIPGFPLIMKMSTSLMQGAGSEIFNQAPLAVKESLIFPYIGGVVFVYEVKRRGGWEAVNKLYANPPSSTEQILHPERYFAGEQPSAVGFELPEPEGDRGLIYDNVMGELGWQIYFRHHQPAENPDPLKALNAAEGWRGDRLLATQQAAAVVVYSLSAWDREEDAAEFADALLHTALLRWPTATQRDLKAGLIHILDTGDEFTLIERRQDQVLYIQGSPDQEDTAQAAQSLAELSAHIWLTATIDP